MLREIHTKFSTRKGGNEMYLGTHHRIATIVMVCELMGNNGPKLAMGHRIYLSEKLFYKDFNKFLFEINEIFERGKNKPSVPNKCSDFY